MYPYRIKVTLKLRYPKPSIPVQLPQSYRIRLRFLQKQKKILQTFQDQPEFCLKYHQRLLWLANQQVLGLSLFRLRLTHLDHVLAQLDWIQK
jgi:hypothetical protein